MLLLLLTLGLSAWCAPFCTSRAGTTSCLCPARQLGATRRGPAERGHRSAVTEGCREREVWSKGERFRYRAGIEGYSIVIES